MPRPLIGITTRNSKDADGHPTVSVQHAYVRAITQAGGVAVPIPSILPEQDFLELYSGLNGILFTGGGDIALSHFSGSNHPRIDGVDEARDTIELTLLRVATNDGKPYLGICRGAQVMNVALGGTLYTHIHDQFSGQIDHDYPGNLRRALVHPINVDETTRAAEIFGETLLNVNSLHHQGLKDIAPGIRAAGYAPDGLVEVVELPDHPYAVAVQWHPEWMTDQPAMQRLFRSFVEASGK
ncbi:MAG: gamma-glutamyl-gamma-aminobutyrate hydrolase family protein [Chloroflexota bacterium]